MAQLLPVEHDPFDVGAAAVPFIPVDHDPFAPDDSAAFGARWGETPDTFGARWADMPSNMVRREEANPARAMRQQLTTQGFNQHAGEIGQRWVDEYYKVPGDILQGKYTPQPSDPAVWSEQDQEARNRGASALMKTAPMMALEGAGRGWRKS